MNENHKIGSLKREAKRRKRKEWRRSSGQHMNEAISGRKQENLGPILTMEPFVEKRLLLARLAKLEGQISPTSSCASFELLAFDGKQFNVSMAQEEEQTNLEELKHLREKIKQFELELKGIKQIGKRAFKLCLSNIQLDLTQILIESSASRAQLFC
ncbi:hypothetical protein GPALN_011760 [Globodera pallida]|nr:hypothetical protein GPALN_011760 [Globodera pallida]